MVTISGLMIAVPFVITILEPNVAPIPVINEGA